MQKNLQLNYKMKNRNRNHAPKDFILKRAVPVATVTGRWRLVTPFGELIPGISGYEVTKTKAAAAARKAAVEYNRKLRQEVSRECV